MGALILMDVIIFGIFSLDKIKNNDAKFTAMEVHNQYFLSFYLIFFRFTEHSGQNSRTYFIRNFGSAFEVSLLILINAKMLEAMYGRETADNDFAL